MVDVIQTYGVAPVFVIAIVVITGLFGVCHWIYTILNDIKKGQKEFKDKVLSEYSYKEAIDAIKESDDRQNEVLSAHDEKLDILINSDKSRIKGEILKQFQYFSKKGSIDPYSLDYLHQEYEIYKTEHGNSWVASIMDKIDNLPIEEL